jgi:hypothetical protein
MYFSPENGARGNTIRGMTKSEAMLPLYFSMPMIEATERKTVKTSEKFIKPFSFFPKNGRIRSTQANNSETENPVTVARPPEAIASQFTIAPNRNKIK